MKASAGKRCGSALLKARRHHHWELGAAGKKGVGFTIDGLSRVSGRAARLIYCLFHSHENMQPLFCRKTPRSDHGMSSLLPQGDGALSHVTAWFNNNSSSFLSL